MKKKTKTYKIVSLFASISEESTIFYPIFRLACYKAFLNYIPYGRNFVLVFSFILMFTLLPPIVLMMTMMDEWW